MKEFYYLGGDALTLLRIRQIMTLHHSASTLKYDSDTLYMIQNHLLKTKDIPETNLERIYELRKALDPKSDEKV